MLIFKELQIELEEAKQQVALANSDSCRVRAEERVELLSRIDSFVNSVVWFPQCHFKRELQTYLHNGCSVQTAAKECGISEKRLNDVVLQAHLVLESRFRGLLNTLRQSNIFAVEQEFKKATEECQTLFEYVARSRYETRFHSEVDLGSCSYELRYLQHLFELEDKMQSLDPNKIEHLLYLLFGETNRDLAISGYLLECLVGDLSVAQTLDAIARHVASKRPVIPSFEEV